MSMSIFSKECSLKFKEISQEHGCVIDISNRVLTKNLKTDQDCFNEAIRVSKELPTLRKFIKSKTGWQCGPDGSYLVTNYSFVEWRSGLLLDFEIPVSGRVNSLTVSNIEGYQKGNQVFDDEGYIIH